MAVRDRMLGGVSNNDGGGGFVYSTTYSNKGSQSELFTEASVTPTRFK